MALWLAFFLHAFGVEIYLQLTHAEGERLRRVSYERQPEAGLKYPGSAGLTVDRWGDAEAWLPPSKSDVEFASNVEGLELNMAAPMEK